MATNYFPAANIQPLQQTDPIASLGKVVALRNALATQQYEQQARPLELQQQQAATTQAQMQLAIQQRQLKSQDAFLRAFQDNPTSNGDDLLSATVKNGGAPVDVLPMLESLTKYDQSKATLRGSQLDNAQKMNDAEGQQAQMLLDIKDQAQRQQAYQSTTIPTFQNLGVPANQIPANVPDEQWLQTHASMAMHVDKQLENARQQQTFEQEHGVIGPDRLQAINGLMSQIANTYKMSPITLPPGSTWDDYKTLDKLMEHTGKAQATQAQIATANGFRAQASALATLAAQEKITELNKPTAAEQNRADLAANALENLNTLRDIATRRPDLFGKVAGRLTYARGAVGTSDTDISTMHDVMDNFGRASQGAHAMKGMAGVASAMDAVTNGMHNSPEATLKAIDAATKSLETFQQQEEAARSGARTGFTPEMVPGAKVQPLRQPAPTGAGGGANIHGRFNPATGKIEPANQ